MSELLVLWDIDHTLINAGGVGVLAFNLAFERVFGRPGTREVGMAGRTDRAILIDILRANDIPDTPEHLEALRAASEEALNEVAHLLVERGRVLPGALEALVALRTEPVVQSLLTGNLRRFAEVKLTAFGLLEHVDADLGGYGWADAVRANLVGVARTAAEGRHGRSYAGRATVLVGDTPLDVEAALATGASVVAVATGRFSFDELAEAGAHAVLPDLTDTAGVIATIRTVALAGGLRP